MKHNYNITDTDISQIDFAFIADYDFYLRSVREMGNNAVVKHMKMFRKIINICLGNGWMNLDPYLNFKGKFKKVDKAILTRAELDLMANKEFLSDRLSQVRDTFLFCCFTGLAYSDVQKLERSVSNRRTHIVQLSFLAGRLSVLISELDPVIWKQLIKLFMLM